MTDPAWEDALPKRPARERLHQAWMTSFERPDDTLLVEHLLPSLLGMERSLAQESGERGLFFAELDASLTALRGRFTIVSSPSTGTREDSSYPWLWRYLSHCTVGSTGHAVQHAKLWAFHWKGDDAECEDRLELYVSSTNLSLSAFKRQLQAGWRVLLPLEQRKPTQTNLRSWGVLGPFLEALGKAAGSHAEGQLEQLRSLLGRTACPENTTFIASTPGAQSAASQLAHLEPSELHILTPTVGDWDGASLAAWAKDAGLTPERIHLQWIPEGHPWADGSSGWVLPPNSHAALEASKVQLNCLPANTRFAKEHAAVDERWSHAKLYLLRRRQKRWLLVTSANWSRSAWGAGKARPKNFELGVLFETKWTELERMGEPFDPPTTVPFCTDPSETDASQALAWAEARWCGEEVKLRVRSTDTAPIAASLRFMRGEELEVALGLEGAEMPGEVAGALPWNDAANVPLTARFTQGHDVMEVNVLDLRSPEAFTCTPLPEVAEPEAKELRTRLLLERYGGPVAEPRATHDAVGATPVGSGTAHAGDYSVQAWTDARRAFEVLDCWSAALQQANDDTQREQIRVDGTYLHAHYARSKGAAHAIVAQEFSWRLKGHA
jgi:hypothetical protein